MAPVQVARPAEAAGLIDRLRALGVILSYDSNSRSLRTGDSVAVTLARDR